jgi:ABC-type Mn2+/Zn2+ transport system permease subunit
VFAFEVSVATRALGALPVFAFAVLPAAAGLAVARRLPEALFVAAGVGGASGALGYFGAFAGELPVGASQAGAALLLSACVYLILRWRRG